MSDVKVEGWGRYDDDPNHVGCPRARTDMTPCVGRDGRDACRDDGRCVGCGADPVRLLRALVWTSTKPDPRNKGAEK